MVAGFPVYIVQEDVEQRGLLIGKTARQNLLAMLERFE